MGILHGSWLPPVARIVRSLSAAYQKRAAVGALGQPVQELAKPQNAMGTLDMQTVKGTGPVSSALSSASTVMGNAGLPKPSALGAMSPAVQRLLAVTPAPATPAPTAAPSAAQPRAVPDIPALLQQPDKPSWGNVGVPQSGPAPQLPRQMTAVPHVAPGSLKAPVRMSGYQGYGSLQMPAVGNTSQWAPIAPAPFYEPGSTPAPSGRPGFVPNQERLNAMHTPTTRPSNNPSGAGAAPAAEQVKPVPPSGLDQLTEFKAAPPVTLPFAHPTASGLDQLTEFKAAPPVSPSAIPKAKPPATPTAKKRRKPRGRNQAEINRQKKLDTSGAQGALQRQIDKAQAQIDFLKRRSDPMAHRITQQKKQEIAKLQQRQHGLQTGKTPQIRQLKRDQKVQSADELVAMGYSQEYADRRARELGMKPRAALAEGSGNAGAAQPTPVAKSAPTAGTRRPVPKQAALVCARLRQIWSCRGLLATARKFV